MKEKFEIERNLKRNLFESTIDSNCVWAHVCIKAGRKLLAEKIRFIEGKKCMTMRVGAVG